MRSAPVRIVAALAAAGALLGPGRLAAASPAIEDLSIEELMALRVTTVAKRDQRLSDAAAAVYVITADEIRRAGVTTLPEALRLAPGMTVARINGGQWAISARGFASRFANKLLVLVDGRSVYTPIFAGVFWDALDLPLESVERIEVIRGPGASLWGANAVNGVINIITSPAAAMQGARAAVLAGDVDRGIVEAHAGGALGADAHLRLWARAGERAGSPTGSDLGGDDGWRRARAGFRYDAGGAASTTVSAEVYGTRLADATALGSLVPPYFTILRDPLDNRGAYVSGAWQRDLDGGAHVALRAYAAYDRNRYLGSEARGTTLDVEAQHRFRVDGGHEVTWGAGYRGYDTSIRSIDNFRVPSGRYDLGTAFVQDEFALLDDQLRMTVGARVEHNGFTGLEVQPNLRAAWTPARGHTVWGALSRAVRTPAIATDLGTVQVVVLPPGTPENPSPLPLAPVYTNDGSTRAEVLYAAEAGWRASLGATLAVDLAVYANRYRRLAVQVPGEPSFRAEPVPHLTVPLNNSNALARTVAGAEAVVDWHPWPGARLRGTYTLQTGAENPRHQASLRPSLDLPGGVEADLWLRYADALVAGSGERIPAYAELDVRLGWKATASLELALVGQNLLHRKHREFRSDVLGTLVMDVPRAAYVKLRLAF